MGHLSVLLIIILKFIGNFVTKTKLAHFIGSNLLAFPRIENVVIWWGSRVYAVEVIIPSNKNNVMTGQKKKLQKYPQI